MQKEAIAERQKINRVLVEELSKLVEENPTMRFGQILMNYFYENTVIGQRHTEFESQVYNEEPAKTLAHLTKKLGEPNGNV